MGKSKILVVDDEPINLVLLEAFLTQEGYSVIKASSGNEGIERAMSENPSIILLDVMMPDMTGYEVCKTLKSKEAFSTVPIIMVTALGDRDARLKGLEAGADEYLSKPVDKSELTLRVKNMTKLKAYYDYMKDAKAILEIKVAERTQQLQEAYHRLDDAYLEIIQRLGRAAEYRDDETGEHIQRMSRYCAILARTLGLSPEKQKRILYASPMHDVGKIGIPDGILLKPDPLTSEEFEIMKKHTIIGAQILSGSDHPVLKLAEVMALTHHERWDGKGYPKGLKGEEIPLEGRICAIADFFDACTSERPYRPALANDEALRMIKEAKGKNFDPQVVDAFFECLNEILKIQEFYKDKTKFQGVLKVFKL